MSGYIELYIFSMNVPSCSDNGNFPSF